ncbi:MAG: tetratricopeptide repeat protein [Deltaproteobacteria bacterium]|nr:tetratricopeptide repeat protein [Deltaproteobacteria bacterium]
MATKIKYTEKELKQPDEFNKTVARVIDFTADHSKKILIGLAVIIALLVGGYFVNSNSQKNELEANNMFDNALALFDVGDSQGALKGFLDTAEQYPGEGISNIALYYAAIINFNDGNYNESVNLLNRFESNEVNEPMLVESAILTQGLAYFNQNEWNKAIDYLSKINDPASPYERQAKLHIALSYEQLGDADRAKSIYDQIYQNQVGSSPGLSSVSQTPTSR